MRRSSCRSSRRGGRKLRLSAATAAGFGRTRWALRSSLVLRRGFTHRAGRLISSWRRLTARRPCCLVTGEPPVPASPPVQRRIVACGVALVASARSSRPRLSLTAAARARRLRRRLQDRQATPTTSAAARRGPGGGFASRRTRRCARACRSRASRCRRAARGGSAAAPALPVGRRAVPAGRRLERGDRPPPEPGGRGGERRAPTGLDAGGRRPALAGGASRAVIPAQFAKLQAAMKKCGVHAAGARPGHRSDGAAGPQDQPATTAS